MRDRATKRSQFQPEKSGEDFCNRTGGSGCVSRAADHTRIPIIRWPTQAPFQYSTPHGLHRCDPWRGAAVIGVQVDFKLCFVAGGQLGNIARRVPGAPRAADEPRAGATGHTCLWRHCGRQFQLPNATRRTGDGEGFLQQAFADVKSAIALLQPLLETGERLGDVMGSVEWHQVGWINLEVGSIVLLREFDERHPVALRPPATALVGAKRLECKIDLAARVGHIALMPP